MISDLYKLVTGVRYRLYLGYFTISAIAVITTMTLHYRSINSNISSVDLGWSSPTKYIFEEFMISHGIGTKGYVISRYDDLFISICNDYGLDWRLLSAMCYTESHFRPLAISKGGAIGLLQVMPHIGRAYGVDSDDLLDPYKNIHTACRHLCEIDRMMSLPRSVDAQDHIKFMLVCYNGGIGRLFDSWRLTAASGGDIYSWRDVRPHLLRLINAEIEDNPLVYYGRFAAARYTLAYVHNVTKQYDEYLDQSRHCGYTLYPYARIVRRQ